MRTVSRFLIVLVLCGGLLTGCTREQGTIAAALGVGLLLGVAASVPQHATTCRTTCHGASCASRCVSY